MNTETLIRNSIQSKTNIELNEQDCIGKGQFGEVYLHEVEKNQVAVKCFKNDDEDYAIKEGNVLNQIQSIAKDCPGIFSYYGMKKLDIKIQKRKQFLNQNYQGNCLFLQACDGNLKEISNFPKKEIFNFLSQVSLSLFCLHANGYSHSDLKPENILFNMNDKQQLQYYLADFGVSKFLPLKIETYYQKQSVKGTPFYFSPELMAIYKKSLDEGNYNPIAADVFALGLICLELLIGSQLVWQLNQSYDQEVQYNQVLANIKTELLKLSEFQSKPQDSILTMLLNMASFDRKKRPSTIEICQTLIEAKQFNIDALENKSMKALIPQLITSLKPLSPIQQLQEESKAIIIPENSNQISINPVYKEAITIPTFQSNILQNSTYSSLILSLFEDSNVNLSKIHSQSIAKEKEFDYKKFHADCDNKGSTLLIFTSKEEPHSLFGGMAVSEWKSPEEHYWVKDPFDKSSWLFKIEFEGNKAKLHQWKCIDKEYAIHCIQNNGPFFGRDGGIDGTDIPGTFSTNAQAAYIIIQIGAQTYYATIAYSRLPSNNCNYEKLDLNSQLKNQNTLLFQLQKKISIDCPTKVIGKIMSEQGGCFYLSECEVFAIKK